MKSSILSRISRLSLASLLAPLAVAGAAGCTSSYSHTDISTVSTSDLPSQVTAFHVQVTQGAIVTAHIAPFNSDEKPMVGDVQSNDPSTLTVLHAYGDKNYAFLGVKPGKTTVEFLSDGVVVATIQSEVTAQAVP
jgi:hypothetical protein